MQEASLFDRFFHDDRGNLVIVQPPNLPILVWLGVSLLKLIVKTGSTYVVFDAIAFGSLFTWAWLELFQGVNYFRRTLGLIVLIGAIVSRI
jgi:hypothetical protein